MEQSSIQRHHVESSGIAAIGYAPAHNVLEIEFATGEVYRYYAVPAETFEEIMNAPSKGRLFHERIRGHYPHEKR